MFCLSSEDEQRKYNKIKYNKIKQWIAAAAAAAYLGIFKMFYQLVYANFKELLVSSWMRSWLVT